MTVQVPVPLVIVKCAPALLQLPELEKLTGRPESAAASTSKLVPYTALAGASIVTVIVWLALSTLTDSAT